MALMCDGWTDGGLRCSRSGKHEEGGKVWCGTHAPSKVSGRRRAANYRRYRARLAALQSQEEGEQG